MAPKIVLLAPRRERIKACLPGGITFLQESSQLTNRVVRAVLHGLIRDGEVVESVGRSARNTIFSLAPGIAKPVVSRLMMSARTRMPRVKRVAAKGSGFVAGQPYRTGYRWFGDSKREGLF
jgi:hypothetical protein